MDDVPDTGSQISVLTDYTHLEKRGKIIVEVSKGFGLVEECGLACILP